MSLPGGSLTVWRSRRVCSLVAGTCLVLCLGVLGVASEQTTPASRPNIVLIFPDNLGWGEVGVYGGVRGPLTPRIDKLAAEGIRLNNFNVEFSCTVSRAALMTGPLRDSHRRDAGRRHHAVGSHDRRGAEVGRLRDGALRQVAPRRRPRRRAARAVAPGLRRVLRHPADQQRGADDDRAGPDDAGHVVHLGGQGRRADAQRQAVRHGDAAHDRSRVGRARHRVHGAQRQGAHAVLPLLPDDADPLPDAGASRLRRQDGRRRHRRRDGRSGLQRRAWCSTRSTGSASRATRSCCGAPTTAPNSGGRGADRRARGAGFYNTVMEGGIRTPCIIRWPGRIPAGRVSNEIVHEIDLLPDARRRRRRRHRAEGSRDRRREPAAVPRRQAGEVEPRHACIFYANHAAARGEVARLEAALRVSARGRRGAGAAADAAVQPAVRSEGRDRTSRTPIRGRRA